jgi:ribosomal protein L31E
MEIVMRRQRAFLVCVVASIGVLAPFAAEAQEAGAPVRLRSIKKIFVDKMDNDLDQYIRAEIQKQFKGEIAVVLKPELSDAIMAGVSEHQTSTKAVVTGRYLGLHDTATGSISLLDKSGERVLWSTQAGDRSIWFGSMKAGGPRKVAERLINNFKKAIKDE